MADDTGPADLFEAADRHPRQRLCALFALPGRRGAAVGLAAASTPAATSRTPPIPSAPAPRPARSPRWWRAATARSSEIVVVAEGGALVTPCGGCRQRIFEFGGPTGRRSGRRTCADSAAALPPTNCCRSPSGRPPWRRMTRLHRRRPRHECPPLRDCRGPDRARPRRRAARAGARHGRRHRHRARHGPRRRRGGGAEPGRHPLCRHSRLSRRRRCPAMPASSSPASSRAGASLIMQGRAHYYETGDAARDARSPRTSCAARRADAHPDQRRRLAEARTSSPGSLVRHHRPHQPVRREPAARRPRRRPLRVDDRRLCAAPARSRLKRAALAAGMRAARKASMCWMSGPSFETPAEIRMIADARRRSRRHVDGAGGDPGAPPRHRRRRDLDRDQLWARASRTPARRTPRPRTSRRRAASRCAASSSPS